MMGLHTGQTNNINGRPKGSENKSTVKLRNTVQNFIENNIEGMQANFDQLEAKDKLIFLEKMLSYSLPRLQATQLFMNDRKDLQPSIILQYNGIPISLTEK
jgi:hypothetical protein